MVLTFFKNPILMEPGIRYIPYSTRTRVWLNNTCLEHLRRSYRSTYVPVQAPYGMPPAPCSGIADLTISISFTCMISIHSTMLNEEDSDYNTAWVFAISRPDAITSADDDNCDDMGVEDSLDAHNHPRLRRSLIRKALSTTKNKQGVKFIFPEEKDTSFLELYSLVHCPNMLKFLEESWDRWVQLGPEGRDPGNIHPSFYSTCENNNNDNVPPFVPTSAPLHRDTDTQRAGVSILGQIGFYCIDNLTPIVASLKEELLWDCAIVRTAVQHSIDACSSSSSLSSTSSNHRFVSYAITTHPGHHSSYDSFGGYCYLNHAAMAARLLQQKASYSKVAILDVDYHCGNGTASIFHRDPTILVVSIHCDPAYEYPFHTGFADQKGETGAASETTLHIPLPPHTHWEPTYKDALTHAMETIRDVFQANALVVSLGLDTYDGDTVAVRRAGFHLKGDDYKQMGNIIGSMSPKGIPIVVIQEGGYLMSAVGQAASDVVAGIASLE